MHGNDHPETAYGLGDLGRVLRDRKKYREAESAFREALEIFRRYHGDNYWLVQSFRDELNRVIRAQEDDAGLEAQESKTQEPTNNAEQAADNLTANRSVRLAQEALKRELRDAIASFDKNIASSPDNQSKRLKQAATYRQVAEIDLKQGKIDEAIEYSRSAVATASPLVAEEPNNPSYAEERSRAQLSLAESLARAGQTDESLAAFEAALAMNEEAMAKFAKYEKRDWIGMLIFDACVRMAGALPKSVQQQPEKDEQSHGLFRRAIEQLDRVDWAEAEANRSLELGDKYILIGKNLATDVGWASEVREVERRLFLLLQSAEEKSVGDAEFRQQVGHKFRLWAAALPWIGTFGDSARVALERAIAVFERLTIDFPEMPTAWHWFADTHRYLGRLYYLNGNDDEAEKAYGRSNGLWGFPDQCKLRTIVFRCIVSRVSFR